MTNTQNTQRSATIITKTGGAIRLIEPFIVGNGTAGTLADGSSIWIADSDVAEVIQ